MFVCNAGFDPLGIKNRSFFNFSKAPPAHIYSQHLMNSDRNVIPVIRAGINRSVYLRIEFRQNVGTRPLKIRIQSQKPRKRSPYFELWPDSKWNRKRTGTVSDNCRFPWFRAYRDYILGRSSSMSCDFPWIKQDRSFLKKWATFPPKIRGSVKSTFGTHTKLPFFGEKNKKAAFFL